MSGEFGDQSTYPNADSAKTIMDAITSDLQSCSDANLRDTYVGNSADCPTGTSVVTGDSSIAGETCVTWKTVRDDISVNRYSSCTGFSADKFTHLKEALADYYDKLMVTTTSPASEETITALKDTITNGYINHVDA